MAMSSISFRGIDNIIRRKVPVLALPNYQGMTLRELSKKTGIAAGYISGIERGLRPGPIFSLYRIASALGTAIDALVSK